MKSAEEEEETGKKEGGSTTERNAEDEGKETEASGGQKEGSEEAGEQGGSGEDGGEEEEEDEEEEEEEEEEERPRAKRRRRSREETKAEIPADDALRDFRTVSFSATEMNSHLVCRLCDGYYRDAHTITECLHTFCKSCLLKYLDKGRPVCPHCKVHLGPHPTNVILHDRTLQTLVDKIFPVEDAGKKASPAKEKTSAAASTKKPASPAPAKAAPVPPADQLSFKVLPHADQKQGEELVALEKPYLKTSGRLKVYQLRKYLGKKLGCSIDNLELLCKEHSLAPEHSVNFILRTMWASEAGKPLLISYRKNDAIVID